MRKVPLLTTVAVAILIAAGCGEEQPEPSLSEKLAVIDGHPERAAGFESLLVCLTKSGEPGTETKTQVSDTIVAGWNESGRVDSLWEFANALGSVFGC